MTMSDNSVNDDVSLSDLLGRMDALTQSYSDEDVKLASPAARRKRRLAPLPPRHPLRRITPTRLLRRKGTWVR